MIDLKSNEVWFATGSQHLYGDETLRQVAEDSKKIVQGLNASDKIPLNIVYKPSLTTPDAIASLCTEANSAPNCIGLITWMHTFSPAKMWIAGLKSLNKPFVHLHTQFNREIPWSKIDMDFMNLNQTAHGGREFGYIGSRMRLNRKVIVGYFEDEEVQEQLAIWMRAASAWQDSRKAKIARFGDNMREVAVTEGDKVGAQIQMGYSVYGYGVGDLVAKVKSVSDSEADKLVNSYKNDYQITRDVASDNARMASLKEAARIELGMRHFLEDGDFQAFTTTFEDLHGLSQLPGLAVQRLMADGYGFGAEGDWKTAALVRAMKVMASGLPGGTSFMEDYTYHLEKGRMRVLGAHMLEVCPSIADTKPSLEIHPLSIGGKSDPARLVFNVKEGQGINASIMEMGNRLRIVANPCEIVAPDAPLPNLPVARVVWVPEPNLQIAAAAWILAGGAHHTGFSQAINSQYLEDFAEMAGLEYLLIDKNTNISRFKQELRWNDVYYHISNGLGI
ncbi:MAG: L-arabinose isomerase [Spirochaetales bacterium]|nr:L-arabinose isomerase [Spirochaetales bacterium]